MLAGTPMLATIAPLAADSSDEDGLGSLIDSVSSGLGSLIDSVSSSWTPVAHTRVGTCDSSESAGSEAAIVTVAKECARGRAGGAVALSSP